VGGKAREQRKEREKGYERLGKGKESEEQRRNMALSPD